MRTGKARTGLSARLACHRRRNACGNRLPFGPEVGAVCGKAAHTVLCGGRVMKHASLPLRRREFITLIGGAVAWPLVALAQQTNVPVIGFLDSKSGRDSRQIVAAFQRGLHESGFIEGQNVAIEYRWGENHYDRIPMLVADLVKRKVAVITAPDTASALAAKAATTTIPIVFNTGVDPVAVGLVASLNRPGGNVTGITSLNTPIASKRLELLHEVVPKASTIGLLVNPANTRVAPIYIADMQAASSSLALQILVLNASSNDEIDEAFATLAQQGFGALIVPPDPLFNSRSEQLAALVLRYALPTISAHREFTMAGGLFSYGTSLVDVYRQLGVYTAKILKGENPAELPVSQSTKLELVINLRTAKLLGLSFPLAVLGRADEVIE
jgi:putative tryptophan/tyrosine transport system substrate-binding protein